MKSDFERGVPTLLAVIITIFVVFSPAILSSHVPGPESSQVTSSDAPETLPYDIIVAQDGSGDFKTIMEAIEAARAYPPERVTIFIKQGVYREKVVVPSWNTRLTMIGEDRDRTRIIYDDHFRKIDRGRNSTFHTYTMRVQADDFHARNLTIENTAGPVGQALALFVEGDRVIFENCRFLGHQDTIFTAGEGARHFFENCYIDGTTDYIFGPGTAVFRNSILHSKRDSYITAASTPENVSFGLVFKNCVLTADPNISRVYLGRPWRPHARTVFIDSEMGPHILPEGWHNWGNPDNEETVFYAEYHAGRSPEGRVPWSVQLNEDEAAEYSLETIFSGWNPDHEKKSEAWNYAGDEHDDLDKARTSNYLETVRTFADIVLEQGRDRYGEVHSPLFVDGIDVKTFEPVKWHLDGNAWVMSNFGSQQNLLRVLVSLSKLTGDDKYRKAAEEATRYMFEHHSDDTGLLHWGGHQFVDLETMEHQFESRPHELKNHFPYYEFLWEVDSSSTRKMMKSIMSGHILDWSNLDMNRHASYNTETDLNWDQEFTKTDPFFEGDGLSFINFGTDMIHVAMTLSFLDQNERAREWGLRLFNQYVRARHPETGLGVYQYSQPRQREIPPEDGPLTGRLTYSSYGDRAKNQFGDVYGDIALEGNVLWGNRVRTIYGLHPIMTLYLAEQLSGTEAGENLLKSTLEGMRAIAEYAYVPEENHFRPMWADGTDLSEDIMLRTGYYGREGNRFQAMVPDGIVALSFARAARMSGGDDVIWRVIRHIMMAHDLGDPGEEMDAASSLNMETTVADPDLMIAVLELYQATDNKTYLNLARQIGDNIISRRYHNGFFQPSSDHVYARFDDTEPLALLVLEAMLSGRADAVPPYLPGVGGTQGEHDITGRTRDWDFYDEVRNE